MLSQEITVVSKETQNSALGAAILKQMLSGKARTGC